MNGTANHRAIVFLAENIDETWMRLQEGEGIIRIYKELFRSVFEMIRLGKLNHSETIMSITLAALHLKIVQRG